MVPYDPAAYGAAGGRVAVEEFRSSVAWLAYVAEWRSGMAVSVGSGAMRELSVDERAREVEA
ncbi:MAG TPA: hypothetical protein VFJ24_01890, partial [Gaiellales bacterium]|nr:hypothetical protein [Gaiellales bacterium]